jgi:2-iminobutanoate/2-iminopropanoate deaminase
VRKEQIRTDRLEPGGHFSQAIAIEAKGKIVFISGMTARQVCENIKSAVESAGGTLDDVCRVDVFVRNIEHFDKIHSVRREYFKAPAPASTMVEVTKMVNPDYLIEINAIAVI